MKLFAIFAIFFVVICSLTRSSESCLCGKNYAPVCGSDNKLYSNECTFKCKQAELKKAGQEVTLSSNTDCLKRPIYSAGAHPCMCYKIDSPVCGSDNKLYSNDCSFRCQQSKGLVGKEVTLSSNTDCMKWKH